MRTIVHLSDLHFGAVREDILKPLARTIDELRPELIAVSGDLTQRARKRQFQEARAFLDTLSYPKVIVPGNHDIPLYNVYSRFRKKLALYQQYITQDLEPFYLDPEIAVLGVNTARSFTFKGGRVNNRQLALLRERLAPLKGVTKVIVTHHPFDLPEIYPEKALVGRARIAMVQLADSGIDLFLAGHLHIGMTHGTTFRFKVSGHSSLLVQAGTATSVRSRGEANSFNVIRINRPNLAVVRFTSKPADRGLFHASTADYFRHTDSGWVTPQKPPHADAWLSWR